MNLTIKIRLEYEVLTDAMNAAVDQRRYREPEILQTYRDAFRLEPEPPTISMEPAPPLTGDAVPDAITRAHNLFHPRKQPS